MFIMAQVFGLLASAATIASVQFKKKEHILILVIIGSIFFTINYVLLEAYSGAATCALGVVISSTIFLVEKMGRRVKWWLAAIFALALLVSVILTFQTHIDILPFVSSMFWLSSMLQRDENRLRWLLMGNTVGWAIYGIVMAAYTGLIASVFSIVSISIALIRFRKKGR